MIAIHSFPSQNSGVAWGGVAVLEYGSLLRVCRTYWGLTQAEMAELLCTSQPVYSRIESGLRPVSVKALQHVANSLGIRVEALMLAHLLLDENLEAIEQDARDAASRTLLLIADKYRQKIPLGVRNSAALGLLCDQAPE